MIPAQKSRLVLKWFSQYNRNYISRSFRAVHILGEVEQLAGDQDLPVLVYFNHSSWWDLLLTLHLNDAVLGWDSYGPMDEDQLKRYRFFTKLGIIGVDRKSLKGAKEFTSYAVELLKGTPKALWIAPQGEIVSNDLRPLRFLPGLSAIAEQLGQCYVLPIAIDYEFWSEKQPEAFLSIGKRRHLVVDENFSRKKFTQECEATMTQLLAELTTVRIKRDSSLFVPLMVGKEGISPAYDLMRRVSATLRGESFSARHSAVKTPPWKRRGGP